MAASAFGAGFGGAVWAMIGRESAERVVADWKAAYVERFPAREARSRFMITMPGGPAGSGWSHG